MNFPIKVIDLFSGAGGMTAGFEWLSSRPYRCVWANDFNQPAVSTFNRNFGTICHGGDIVSLLDDPALELPSADVVVGGPPCQGFSLLNKKRSNDPRKKLWIPFMEVVERVGAKFFVMENVPQLLGSLEHEEICAWARERGFKLWSGKVVAADYGVPQTRTRALVVGALSAEPKQHFPMLRTHYDPSKTPEQLAFLAGSFRQDAKPWVTVRDAIVDLPKPQGTEIRDCGPPLDLHFGRNPTEKSVARYQAIPKEGMNRFDLQRIAPELTPQCWIRKKKGGTDLFGRLWWDRPAFTIRTEFYKPEKGRYLHPKQHRPITHREAARFQSFPDEFIFTGSKIEIARQIGNAVPPMLGKAIADRLYEMISSTESSDKNGYFHSTETPGNYVVREEPEYAPGASRPLASTRNGLPVSPAPE